jgi:MoaA/NifB/PqqE/SkfB family radical SAM enzyme
MTSVPWPPGRATATLLTVIRHVDIKLSYACNNACIHCVVADQRDGAMALRGRDWRSTAEVAAELQDAARKGFTLVTFTGGEPTIRADLHVLIRAARALGLSVGLQTNGRMLSVDAVRQRLLGMEVRFVVAVHGPDAAIHDAVTRAPGSFEQTLAGIRGLLEAGEKVTLKTVLSRTNVPHLPALVERLAGLGVRRFNLTFPHALGNGRRDFEAVVPRFTEAMPFVLEALDIAGRHGCEAVTEAIPPCLLGRHADRTSEAVYRDRFRSEVRQLDQEARDWTRDRTVDGKVHADGCAGCPLAGGCEGAWREYVEAYGGAELAPPQH